MLTAYPSHCLQYKINQPHNTVIHGTTIVLKQCQYYTVTITCIQHVWDLHFFDAGHYSPAISGTLSFLWPVPRERGGGGERGEGEGEREREGEREGRGVGGGGGGGDYIEGKLLVLTLFGAVSLRVLPVRVCITKGVQGGGLGLTFQLILYPPG